MEVVKIELEREDGERFVIDNTDWLIPNDGLEGFATVETDISTVESLLGDGSIITAVRVPHKARTVKCEVRDAKYNEQLRTAARAFFNPHADFKMYVTYMGTTRWCTGSLNKFNLSEGNVYRKVTMQFTLLSASPYLKSYDDFGKDIAKITPMTAFPYMSNPAWGGAPTGRYDFKKNVKLYNDGDTTTAARFVIAAKDNVTNPQVSINGNYIKLLDTMHSGDTLEIDLARKPPRVTLNGENAIGKCDKHSSFTDCQLNIGDNDVSFNADANAGALSVSVYYNKLYSCI